MMGVYDTVGRPVDTGQVVFANDFQEYVTIVSFTDSDEGHGLRAVVRFPDGVTDEVCTVPQPFDDSAIVLDCVATSQWAEVE